MSKKRESVNKLKGSLGLTIRLLSWFLGISFVSIAIIAFLSNNFSQKSLETASLHTLSALAQSNEQKIINFFDSRQKVMLAISSSSNIQNMEDASIIQSELEKAFDNLKDGGVSGILLLNKDGKIIASSDKTNIGLNKKDNDYFLGAISKKGFYIKDLYQSETTGGLVFSLSIPLFSDGENAFTGVLVEHIDSSILYTDILSDEKFLGETADIYLVNSEGYLMTPNIIEGEDAILKTKLDTQAVKDCVKGLEFFGLVKDNSGVNVFSSYSSVNLRETLGKDWCVVVEQDATVINMPIKSLQKNILIIAGILALVIIGLAIFASKTIGDFVRWPIRSAALQISSAATQFIVSSQQTAAAAEQNTNVTRQMASGAIQQSKQADEISGTISKMATTFLQMGTSSEEAVSTAVKVAQDTRSSSESGQKSQQSLKEIQELFVKTSDSVKNLATSSRKITDIVETITGISEQTNLLALNAAIEAARAGEAGRGFAVVADEVRKLAEESTKATEEIKGLIFGMTNQMQANTKVVEEGDKILKGGMKTIEETLASLIQMAEAVEQVSAKVQELSTGVQEQSAGVQKVARSMDSIAAVAEQNSSGAQQLYAASQEQSSANQQIVAGAIQLKRLANELTELTGRVKQATEVEYIKEELITEQKPITKKQTNNKIKKND